ASSPAVAARNAAHSALSGIAPALSLHAPPDAAASSRLAAELAAQAALLRCLFGPLPFRPTPRLDATILDWNDAALPPVAPATEEERRFDDLPVLADALEEAGCTDAEMLGHCRSGGEHARGCWALDVVTGRT